MYMCLWYNLNLQLSIYTNLNLRTYFKPGIIFCGTGKNLKEEKSFMTNM